MFYLCACFIKLYEKNDTKMLRFSFAYLQSSSGSLSMLVRAVLLDKKPEEVPMVRFNALTAVYCIF